MKRFDRFLSNMWVQLVLVIIGTCVLLSLACTLMQNCHLFRKIPAITPDKHWSQSP